ncbi:MAG: hypothetical protein FWG02_07035 [Holophagaceae bacterium]|nr:hypothetical protein [Holophagaceae bacterium]
MEQPHLIFRVHADTRLGFGHVSRAVALAPLWTALGGNATIAISGDDRAEGIVFGSSPFSGDPLPCPAIYIGNSIDSPLPEDIKSGGTIALLDLWSATQSQVEALRPLKVALMEDDGDAQECADLLFQPYLDGLKWGKSPIRTENGIKLRPFEEQRGKCRVLKGSEYIVLSAKATHLRPRRDSTQPLNIKKLLVTFGGTDGPGLASLAFKVLNNALNNDDWGGNCTLLSPRDMSDIDINGNPRISVLAGINNLTAHLQEYDAIWCAGGITLAECLYFGIPVAAWAQNDRQQGMISDIAMEGACINLGIGVEADLSVVQSALSDWLGPLGQETRQEQSANGMTLIDGSGANRVIQELWTLAHRDH